MEELAGMKLGVVAEEDIFRSISAEFFTGHYKPLIPWVGKLRKVVFPDGGRWKRPEPKLYSSMKKFLREAREDPKVLAEET